MSGMGAARAMALAPDDSVYVLLSASPWIAHIDAATKSPTGISIQAGLDWAKQIVVDADGSLLALGTAGGNAPFAQVQRFDPTGALLGSTKWLIMNSRTTFVGVGTRAGQVLAVATTGYHLEIATITKDTTLQVLAAIDFRLNPFMNQMSSAFTAERVATSLGLGPSGEILLAGTVGSAPSRIDGTWFAILEANGSPRVESIEGQYDLFETNPRIAMNAAGDVYEGWSWRFKGSDPNDGYISRANGRLARGWMQTFDAEKAPAPRVVNAVVPLPDGVLALGDVYESTMSTTVGPWGARLNTTGDVVTTDLSLTAAVVDAMPIRGLDLYLLESTEAIYQVERLRFDELLLSRASPGDKCLGDDDCANGRCCQVGTTAEGVCSTDPKCAFGNSCHANGDCTDGLCLLPVPGASGMCTKTCTASVDCPTGSYCAASVCAGTDGGCPLACLPDCLSGAAARCSMLNVAFKCTETTNAEGVAVSVCH